MSQREKRARLVMQPLLLWLLAARQPEIFSGALQMTVAGSGNLSMNLANLRASQGINQHQFGVRTGCNG